MSRDQSFFSSPEQQKGRELPSLRVTTGGFLKEERMNLKEGRSNRSFIFVSSQFHQFHDDISFLSLATAKHKDFLPLQLTSREPWVRAEMQMKTGSLPTEWLTCLPLGAGFRWMTEMHRPWTFQAALRIRVLLYLKMGRFSVRHRRVTDGESGWTKGESLYKKATENQVGQKGGSLVLKSIVVRHDAIIQG